ncbi:MAG: four helix bundle protein [Chloroflexota bacterium]
MAKSEMIRNFWDLIAYQKARNLAREVFNLSKSFPREENYSLTDQIRRASRSVGAQIAEGWGKRRYEKVFISKLVDADGEQYEVQHWALVANDCGYIDEDSARKLIDDCREINRLIHGMINKSSQFCGPKLTKTINEEALEYFVNGELYK